MPLPPCRLCGQTDPARMIGLMTLWYGHYVGIEPDHGYFYLCPGCFGARVEPFLEEEETPEEE